MSSAEALLDIERTRLVAVMEGTGRRAVVRAEPVCGWRVRDVAVHLLMPHEISLPRLALTIAAARFDASAAFCARAFSTGWPCVPATPAGAVARGLSWWPSSPPPSPPRTQRWPPAGRSTSR